MIIATLARGGDDHLAPSAAGDSVRVLGGLEGATTFTVSPSGFFYVLRGAEGELIRLTEKGNPDRQAGGFGWGQTGFDGPTDVAVPTDLEVYISDYGNDRIVRLDRSLGISTVFETVGENTTFRFPLSVCVSGSGKLLVVDGEFGRIVEIDRADRISRIFGVRGSGPGSLDHPVRVRTDGDSLIAVHDRTGLVLFDIYGNYVRTLGRGVIGEFSAFTFRNGALFVLDSNSVRRHSPAGDLLGGITLPDSLAGGGDRFVDVDADSRNMYLLTASRIFVIELALLLGGK